MFTLQTELKNIFRVICVIVLLTVFTPSFGQTTAPAVNQKKVIPGKLVPSAGISGIVSEKGEVPEEEVETVPSVETEEIGKETIPEKEKEIEKKEEEKEYSAFQKYIMNQVPVSVSREVEHFGYNFFQSAPETFAPVQSIPVSEGYVIGPDDEIRINIWGMVEGIWDIVVDRDGNINIPTVGTVSVVGLTYENLQPFLEKEISKYYKDFHLNVSMGELRTIPVYLVGSVRRPGSYTVSSLSTLVNALFVSGGPSVSGTMRDIHLKRQGKTVVRFDMYDFLLKGDKTKDVRLQPEDVIFVPSVGPLAAIIGSVTNPAIYELKGDTRITGLIDMAGGISATGYLKRIQVERISENETRIVLDKNLSELTELDDIKLINGDVVVISPVSDKITNAITLKGNVVRPGNYQWFEGIRISDIIKDVEKDLLPETNFEYGLIERTILPSHKKELIFFNLGKALIEKDRSEDRLLQPYDTVEIYSLWQYEERPKVKIAGAVARPGDYTYKENMKVSDLIKIAGGIKHFAYKKEAELTRVFPTPDGPETERLNVNLEKVLQGDPVHDITLLYDDYLFIRPVPGWDLYKTVEIAGEVKFPGTYTIKKGETITSLIARAGGFTGDAYVRGIMFTREDVRRTQQEQMDKMINQLEMELLAPKALPADATMADVQAQEAEILRKQELIRKLRGIKSNGRVIISLVEKSGGKMYDIELQEGDKLSIPKNPGIVSVLGAVYNPTSFVYGQGINYGRYLNMAGGFTPTASRGELYIIKVDGSIVKPGRGYQLEPGDAIVAPEKIEITSIRREMREIIDILYKAAMVVAVTTTIF